MRKFFVHIIESPSSNDLLNNIIEGHLLIEGLRIANIMSTYNLAVDKSSFMEAIGERFHDAIKNYGVPFLHLSAHGNKNGLELTDKTFIKWTELKNILLPISNALRGNLFLNISSCSGFSACSMAMNFKKEIPFYGLVGPTGELPLADITIGFVAFYHNFAKGASAEEAIEAMKKASRNNKFEVITAAKAKLIWKKEIDKIMRDQLIKKLLKIPPPK